MEYQVDRSRIKNPSKFPNQLLLPYETMERDHQQHQQQQPRFPDLRQNLGNFLIWAKIHRFCLRNDQWYIVMKYEVEIARKKKKYLKNP